MKLSNITAQRLLGGLRTIDADPDTKLDAEIRLKIAININRVVPHVQAFEKTIQHLQSEAAKKVNGYDFNAELSKIVDLEESFRLKLINKDDLKLKENVKIKTDTISAIAPIIRGFDDGESDEE